MRKMVSVMYRYVFECHKEPEGAAYQESRGQIKMYESFELIVTIAFFVVAGYAIYSSVKKIKDKKDKKDQ